MNILLYNNIKYIFCKVGHSYGKLPILQSSWEKCDMVILISIVLQIYDNRMQKYIGEILIASLYSIQHEIASNFKTFRQQKRKFDERKNGLKLVPIQHHMISE